MSCSGADDAVLSVTVPIGEDPAAVFWVTGTDTLYGSVLTGMGPGTYSVFVPGCPVPDFVFVQEPPPISIFQIGSTPPTCDDPCGGTAVVQAIGGTEPYTYSWVHDPLETGDAATGLCTGSTAVSVVDDFGCGSISAVTLSIPYPTADISSTPQTCEGVNDATLSASASGGSGAPFTFVWDHGPVVADLADVSPGTYVVTATDAGGCEAWTSLDIVEAAPLVVTSTSTPVQCWGEANGSVSAAAPGLPPIIYTWLFPDASTATGSAQNDLPAGNYTVTVTDDQGCSGAGAIDVLQPAELTAELLAISPACTGESNGAVAVSPIGGTLDYTLLWTLPDASTTTGLSLQNLAAGIYSIAITDANSCAWSGSINVEQTPDLAVIFDVMPPTCYGESTGAVVASVSGGTGAIGIVWEDGTTGAVLPGVAAGTYGVALLDEAGCTLDSAAVVTSPEALTLTIDALSPPCAGESTGWATATATGGTAPWFYAWSGPLGPSIGPSITNLIAGVYDAGVVDDTGCTATASVVLADAEPIDFSATVTGVSCAGDDGAISASPTGGTGGLTTTWTDGVTIWESASISNLLTGTYSGLCTDAVGCVATLELVIEAAAPLSALLNWPAPNCAGETVSFSAIPMGGQPSYTLTLTAEDAPTSPIDGGLWGALSAGDYALNVVDAAACSFDTIFSITAPEPLAGVADITGISCFGLADGSIVINPSGGSPAVEAQWLDAPSLPAPALIRTGLAPGFYITELMDAAGCTYLLDTLWVDGADALALDVTVIPESCDGINLGAVLLEASGGTAPFLLTLDGALESGPEATPDPATAYWPGLQSGDYAASLTDDAGCNVELVATVTQPDPFTWSVAVTDLACETSPGGIAITWEGGTAPFSWTGAGAGGTWTSADTTGLAPGAYAISMSDGAGCLADSVVSVGLIASLNLTLETTHPSCAGHLDGAFNAVTTGGSDPIQLGINGPLGPLEQPYIDLASGSYTGWTIDDRGCTDSVVVDLVDPPALSASDSSWAATCPGGSDGGTLLIPSGGSPDYTVSWGDGSTDLLHENVAAGIHSFTIEDVQGCSYTGAIDITAPNPVAPSINWTPPVCTGGSDGMLALSLAGGTGDFSLVFDGAAPTTLQPGALIEWSDIASGPHNIVWTDEAGCSGDTALNLAAPQLAELSLSIPELACTGDSILFEWAVVQSAATDSLTVLSGLPDSLIVGNATGQLILPAGIYTVGLQNSAGCVIDSTFEVEPLSNIGATYTALQPDCQGQSTGAAWIEVTGAAGDWILVVEGAADTASLGELLPGAYPYALMDDAGCVFRDTIDIDPASTMGITATSTPANCAENEDGAIFLEANDAVGAVTWAIDPADGEFEAPSSFVNLGAGSYWVEATDEAGCSVEMAVEVSAPAALQISIDTLVRPACVGDANGWITVSTSGGQGDFIYNWTLDGAFLATGPSLADLAAGNYALTVEDAAGCQTTLDALQIVAQGDVSLTLPSDTALCTGDLLALTASVQGASTIAWTINGSPASNFPEVSAYVQADTSIWACTALQLGCVKTAETQVVGWANPLALAGPDLTLLQGEQAIVGAPAPPESDLWTWDWSPASAIENPSESAPLLEPVSASLELVLTVTSAAGCAATDTALIHLIPELGAPTGFTPNDDGWNDLWNIAGAAAYPSLEVVIFNRWGAIVYELPDPTEGWDGRDNNGVELPVGTYFALFRATESFIEFERTGTLTIMR